MNDDNNEDDNKDNKKTIDKIRSANMCLFSIIIFFTSYIFCSVDNSISWHQLYLNYYDNLATSAELLLTVIERKTSMNKLQQI